MSPAKIGLLPQDVHDRIGRNMAAFSQAGGRIQVLDGSHSERLARELPPRNRSDHRTNFIHNALNQAQEHHEFDDPHKLIVARDRHGRLVGAMSMQYTDPDMTGFGRSIHVDEVGSNGTVPGAGISMAVAASRYAGAEQLPITGTYADNDAKRFWEGVGWKMDPTDEGASVAGWTPAEATEIANQHRAR